MSRARTHPGCVRAENQDAVLDCPEAGLWLVADGMGGHASGELASQAVVRAMHALAEQRRGEALAAGVTETLQLVNEQLQQFAAQSARDVVGTTVAVLVMEGEQYHCFWAGDSRIYLFRNHQLRQLSKDHAESLGALHRAVGAEPHLEVDYAGGTLFEDDVFLLCTDGLNKVVSDRCIAECLVRRSPASSCDELVSIALEAGAPDNVSCLTVFVGAGNGC